MSLVLNKASQYVKCYTWTEEWIDHRLYDSYLALPVSVVIRIPRVRQQQHSFSGSNLNIPRSPRRFRSTRFRYWYFRSRTCPRYTNALAEKGQKHENHC